MVLYGNTVKEILPLQDLYDVYGNHKRLKLFAMKGRACVICDREGTLLLRTIDSDGHKHTDLYTDDFILMTIDHIVPKSQCDKIGWSKFDRESLDNKQPMCAPCNNAKANKLITNKEFRAERCRDGYPHKLASVEIIRQLVNNTLKGDNNG